jgi:peptidoglycan/xylan/chitin deacetylase (PgdA/CDA1 family)
MKNPVSILVTWDIDPAPEVSIENKKEALKHTRRLLRDEQIQSTFFFHARIAGQLNEEIEALIEENHEIGCHGLTHGNEEDYGRMPEDMQRGYLYEATEILRKSAGRAISSFRGPRMKTSHITQKVLVELGYSADCSVASQRMDFVSSNLINVGWVFAPRLPYRPSRRSAFRKGDQNIWVVPLSALVLPFISSTLYALKRRFTKGLFRALYR